MNSDIIDTVTEWDSVPVAAGYEGLRELEADEFTGAVGGGMAWAFMLNGRVVGVFDGTIESFEDAEMTAYAAPHTALPLLCVMREAGGKPRAKYYTNDTPLADVDATLQSGKFTGYVELSDNVLSGDYYVVYYGGKQMSVAYVGNSRKLLTDEEAFERANDEVGIYEVREVPIDIVTVPETEPEIAETDPDSDDAIEEAESTTTVSDAGVEEISIGEVGPEAETPSTPDESPSSEESDELAPADAASTESVTEESGDDDAENEEPNLTETGAADTTDDDEVDDPSREPTTTEPTARQESATESGTFSQPDPSASGSDDEAAETGPRLSSADATTEDRSEATGAEPGQDKFSEEAQWQNARAIPALDPKKSTDEKSNETNARPSRSDSKSASRREATPKEPSARQKRSKKAPAGSQRIRQQLEKVNAARKEAVTERDRLKQELETLQTERNGYKEEVERLQGRVTELEAEVERLERELEADDDSATPKQTMGAREALDGTNLFVRYGSKGEGTLEKAQAGTASREEVNGNLRLEHHTGFDDEGLVVEDEPFETFLHDTIEYGFVNWVVRHLFYEIRDTGTDAELADLFDAIPKIDRAELHGQVSIRYTEGGEEHREQQQFDVVMRDRMGNPLVVANLNASRDPATEGMMDGLIENAERLKETSDSLGAAVLVTASYFEPEALERASNATGGGLLSRSRRKSFVRLSRKRGFHLCLVEARNNEFHVTVPEL
ncbi:MAG: DUF7527 domain-containing protein [Halobacteriota archaeon]